MRAFIPYDRQQHNQHCGSTANTPLNTHPAAQLLSWDTAQSRMLPKGLPGRVPGRGGTAAPPGHCCSVQSGEVSQPQKSHKTWLSSFRHWQWTHSSNGGRCQQQQQIQFNQTRKTSGATIYCAKFSNGLSGWSNVGSPECLFIRSLVHSVKLPQILCIPFSPRLKIFA